MSEGSTASEWTLDDHPRYPPQPTWKLWDDERLPREEEEAFRELIHRKSESPSNSATPEPKAGKNKEDHHPTWDNAPNSKCYASFGDKGTTASVGAYGHLMQISQYLEAGRSGMFALVSRDAEEPRWPISRAQELQEMSHNRSATSRGISFGLELEIPGLRSRKRQPQLKWVNWRWPRFEYHLPKSKLKVSVQWMVKDRIVLQQWIVENEGNEDVLVPVQLGRDMWIQDLEYLDYENNYNDRMGPQGQFGSAGPCGYGWVLMHPFDEHMGKIKPTGFSTLKSTCKIKDERTSPSSAKTSPARKPELETKINDTNPTTVRENQATQVENDSPIATAVMAVFVNGRAHQFQSSEDPTWGSWNEKLPRQVMRRMGRMEITAAYKMILVPRAAVDFRNFLIPASEANVTRFLAEEVKISPYSLSAIDLREKRPFGTGTETGSHLGPTSPSIWPKDNPGENDKDGVKLPNTASLGCSEIQQFPRPSGCPTNLSLRHHLDFVTWRNLEHILSVCAIPLNPPLLVERRIDTSTSIGPHAELDVDAVALTCGDFSGHRLYNPASFFAFEFLIDIAQRLKHVKSTDGYISELQSRIYRVCKGHIIWLLRKAEVSQQTECLKGDYFATGRAVPTVEGLDEWDSVDSFVLKDTVTDNPLQIIKACNFTKFYKEESGLGLDFLKTIGPRWVSMLSGADKRAKFAWPRNDIVGNETRLFRLDDHVWIWRALKSLQDRGIWKEEARNDSILKNYAVQPDEQDEEDEDDDASGTSENEAVSKSETGTAKLIKFYAPAEVQRQVLQRFTVLESDVTQRRMLAVTRSTERTRFLFHARDTTLFYGDEWGFFSASGKSLWENTLNAQRIHNEDDASRWDNAIRFGLGLIMGIHKSSIGGLDPGQLIHRGVDVLFRSTSPNGFFPGQLDEESQQPTLFYRDRFRDFYFHASFEIPFILLRYANQVCEIYESSTRRALEIPSITITVLESPAQNPDVFRPQRDAGPTSSASFEQQRKEAMVAVSPQQTATLKKVVPLGSGARVDQRRIMELTDEWLYNYPPFLENNQVPIFTDALQHLIVRNLSKGPMIKLSSVFGAVWAETLNFLEVARLDSEVFSQGQTAIIDIGRKKRGRRNGEFKIPYPFHRSLVPNHGLSFALAEFEPRIAATAKKRFIWLAQADPLTALICYIYAADAQKVSLSRFFDRHSNNDNYFNDDPTRLSNSWETEMHVSFYVVTSAKPPIETKWSMYTHTGAGQADFPGSEPFEDRSIGSRVFEVSRKKIFRASFGFRFDGDFFDRYWTCHFIEHVPAPASKWNLPFQYESKTSKDDSWRQRKVLELHICDRILDSMLKGSGDILEETRRVLHVKAGFLAYTVGSNDEFKRLNDLWESIQPILRTVHDELSTAISCLVKWASREKDREAEAPRWTRNDERKYRGILNKLEGSTSRKIDDVQRILGRIESLEKFLDSYFDKTRTRLSNENMVTFTYVTVIFLPLGFAASIFSMGGAPDRLLLSQMVVCAIVTFFLTVIVLLNAKMLLSVLNLPLNALKWMIRQLDEHSWQEMQASHIFQNYSKRLVSERRQEEPPEAQQGKQADNSAKAPRDHVGTTDLDKTAIHWLFWPAYLLAEVPARIVLKACRALHRKDSIWRLVIQVLFGLLSLPIFIMSWVCQVFCYNIADLVQLTFITITLKSPSRSVGTDQKNIEKDEDKSMKADPGGERGWRESTETETSLSLMNLTYPLDSSRPFRRLIDRKRLKMERVTKNSVVEENGEGRQSTGIID